MRLRHGWLICFMFLVATGSLLPQSAEAPKLKPEVALAIRDLQLERSENQTKMLVFQQQYLQAQEAVKQLDAQLATKLGTALKDSGLDPDHYALDPQTLSVRPDMSKPTGGAVIPAPRSQPPPPPGLQPHVGGTK